MKVIAVVGSASGSGKTRLVCELLRAIPGLGAVKISPREGFSRVEWGAGAAGKDTARFAASGAALVARIVGPRDCIRKLWDGMYGAFAGCPGIIVEGAGALDCTGERFTIFVVAAGSLGKRPERDGRLAAAADCIVAVHTIEESIQGCHPVAAALEGGIPVFSVSLSDEKWLNETLLGAVRDFLFEAHGVRWRLQVDPAVNRFPELKHDE